MFICVRLMSYKHIEPQSLNLNDYNQIVWKNIYNPASEHETYFQIMFAFLRVNFFQVITTYECVKMFVFFLLKIWKWEWVNL